MDAKLTYTKEFLTGPLTDVKGHVEETGDYPTIKARFFELGPYTRETPGCDESGAIFWVYDFALWGVPLNRTRSLR